MPNIRFLNDFDSDNAAIAASSEENSSDVAAKNVIDNIVGRKWRTGRGQGFFRVWVGGPDQNDFLNFTIDGGGEQTVQLTRGVYTATTLATEIQTQLQTVNGNLTCTYSAKTNKFTIALSGGSTVALLTQSGTNAADAIWGDIGFAVAADIATAVSLEAGTKKLHMEEYVQCFFGTLTVRDATTTVSGVVKNRNDKINFKESSTGDELTATIPPGDYPLQDLVEEIEFQLQRIGAENYAIIYDKATRKVKFSTDGDFLSILWKTGTNGTDGTNECFYLGVLMGLDDADPATDSTGATSYTLDFPVFPEFTANQITLAAMFGHTLSSSATLQLLARYAADIFRFDGSLESLNNPSDVMVFTEAFKADWIVKPGATDLGGGVMITG